MELCFRIPDISFNNRRNGLNVAEKTQFCSPLYPRGLYCLRASCLGFDDRPPPNAQTFGRTTLPGGNSLTSTCRKTASTFQERAKSHSKIDL